MNNTMNYKGYTGSIEFSEDDELFYGKVLGIRALISYDGKTATDLVSDFHSAVDDYLILCEEKGIQPEKAYKGSFNVRISPKLHQEAAIYAATHDMSLNSFVERAVSNQLGHREYSSIS